MPERKGAKLRLEDGEVLRLDPDETQALYDELWRSAAEVRGAISAAAKIRHAQTSQGERLDTLSVDESWAIRHALGRDRGRAS